jgi:glycosyltransferase involved in cell wall biosynthesis
VYTVHGLAHQPGRAPWARLALFAAETCAWHAADRVISVCHADVVPRRWWATPARHIGNAVDTDRFAPGDRSQARQALGLPVDAVVVGAVARFVPQKGLSELIAAWPQPRDATLCLVGQGPLEAKLKAAAARHGASVRFFGWQTDVAALLRAFDVFVLPSLWEGEPLALLEAMATGLACIATDTPAAAALLDGAGVVVPNGDAPALGQAIASLTGSADQRLALGRAARARALERTWPRVAEQTLAVYREALTRAALRTRA